jgi:N utilization substance protein B
VTDLPTLEPDNEYDVEEIEHDPPMTVRSLARRVTLQVLYELDSTAHLPERVIEARLDAQNPEDDTADRSSARYVRMIVYGVLKYRAGIDRVIRHFAPEWPLEQVATIDRNILRIALFEFAVSQSVPMNVAIDEAVALAQMFGADGSVAFVNGVLGQVARREAELHSMLDEPASGDVTV